MIVRNEEAHLARALRHANTVADEIIVLDTGSTDRTPEIAEQCGATVHRFAWCDDFAKARNESLRHCTKEFVMWLDADDVLELQDAERVRALLNEPVEWDVLYLPYQYSKGLRKKPPRIFRNGMGIQWIYPVHEILRFPPGTRWKRDIENICINHQPLRHRAANSPTYLRLLDKAIRTPEFANSNYMLWHIAKEYSNLRDLPKAVYYFQQAIQHGSGTESYLLSRQYLGLARQYRRLGNLPRAISAFGNAALYYPGWREPYCGIAEMLWELGDLNSARACVEIARKIARHSLSVERLELYDATNFHTKYVQRAETLMESRPQRATHKPSNSSPSFTLVAGGDVCLARQMQGYVSKHGAHWPLSEIRSVVQRADAALVNLECVLSTCGARIDKGGRRPFYYRAHPQLLDVLSRAGINVVTTSNNHAMDYGPEALLEQNRLLGKCGFAVCGAGTTLLEAARPTYVKAGDLTMAVIGIETEEPFGAATGATPGVNHAKGKDAILRRLVTSIGEAREHADLIVVSPHWGANWVERPTPERRELARQIIELGADAILGHSAHILQGVEVYKGYPIVYDMGSLLFDRVQENRMHQSALFELEFCETGFSRLTIHPLRLRSGRATLPNRQEADDILALIRTLSMELGPLPWNAASGTISISLEPEFERKQRSRIDASEIMIGSRWPQALPSQYAQSPTAALLEDLPCYADFLVNDDIVLVGAQIPEAVRPGRGFLVDILLRVAGPLVGRWEGRITAYDEQGQAAFTWTHPISDGDVSPTQWRTGQLILNKTLVRPPRDYPVGRYSLYFDLVDRDSDRHICPLSKREVLADQVSLGTITATPRARGGIAGL